MFTNPMRDQYVWEKLNQGIPPAQERGTSVERATQTGNKETAGLKRRLLLAVVLSVPVALVIVTLAQIIH